MSVIGGLDRSTLCDCFPPRAAIEPEEHEESCPVITSPSLNRLHNIGNQYQGKYKRVLCVCSAGLLRSPTAAWVLSHAPFDCNTRAAGVHDYALVPVDEVLLSWADEVVCMDRHHADICNSIGKGTLGWKDKNVIVLGIPDNFPYRDAKLIKLVETGYQRWLDAQKK